MCARQLRKRTTLQPRQHIEIPGVQESRQLHSPDGPLGAVTSEQTYKSFIAGRDFCHDRVTVLNNIEYGLHTLTALRQFPAPESDPKAVLERVGKRIKKDVDDFIESMPERMGEKDFLDKISPNDRFPIMAACRRFGKKLDANRADIESMKQLVDAVEPEEFSHVGGDLVHFVERGVYVARRNINRLDRMISDYNSIVDGKQVVHEHSPIDIYQMLMLYETGKLIGDQAEIRLKKEPGEPAYHESLRTRYDIQRTRKPVGDEFEIEEAIDNLATNARKSLAKRLKLERQEGRQFKPTVEVRLREAGDNAVVEISDNGVGINPKEMGKIFDSGVTNWEGTGGGLDICRRIMRRHRGKIEVESRGAYTPGAYDFMQTTFRLILPVKD